MPGAWSALRPAPLSLASFEVGGKSACEQEGLPVRVIYGPHARLCSVRAGRPSAPHTGNWKLETEGLSPLRLASRVGKRSTRLTFAPSVCGRLALATTQRPRRSPALGQLPVRQISPGPSRCCGGGP